MRERKQKENIGIQAARFSLYVPFIVFLLGFCTSSILQRDRSTGIALFYFNVVLIMLGLVAGIVALVLISRFGRKGILARSIGGVLLNGALVGLIATFLVPAMNLSRVRSSVIGNWALHTSSTATGDKDSIQFQKDGLFVWTRSDQQGEMIKVLGRWVLTSERMLGLSVEQVENGRQELVGQKIGLGIVQSIDMTRMVLRTETGEDIFQRQ